MKVYLVFTGCVGDYYVIAVCSTLDSAKTKCDEEQTKSPYLKPWVEEWDVE